jgi:hypothetical protein
VLAAVLDRLAFGETTGYSEWKVGPLTLNPKLAPTTA